jgi:hypothetical protein
MVRNLFIKGSHSVRQFSSDYAEQKAGYRFLANERTTEKAIIESMGKRCSLAAKGKVVLSIQDTTEINLYNHKGRIRQDKSIGVTNASRNGLGFMAHPSLVVDAYSSFPYGFCHTYFYSRELEREPAEKRDKHKYKKLGMEEKESNKWLDSCKSAKEALKEAEAIIIVQDREGDIYEQFATVPDGRTHLLVRAKSDRRLCEGGKLFDKVSRCAAAGTYCIELESDKRKGRQKRKAELEVRFTEVVLKNSSRTAQDIAPTVMLYCVEAKEKGGTGKQAVCWRLLTTMPVTSLEEALIMIEWYSWRWMIEEVFRILKKEGFDIESSELGCGTSVRKLCLLTLDAIIKIFQMHIAYTMEEEGGPPAGTSFEQTEIECMEVQCVKLEGKTQKQKNPYPKGSLRYITWVIARLGGWKGYASERRPGITTLWIGLEKFYNIFEGWTIAKDVYKR